MTTEQARDADVGRELRMEDQILVAAGKLFAEHGYASTSTRELASRVGVRSASIYYHFESKEAILRKICEDSLARITAATASSSAPQPSVESFARMIQAHVTTALRDREMHATMLVELRRLSGEHKEHILAARDRHEELLRHEVERMQDAGLIRGDLDGRLITLSLLNLLNWTIFWFREDGSMDPEELGAAFATLFLHGALTGGSTERDARPAATTVAAPAKAVTA